MNFFRFRDIFWNHGTFEGQSVNVLSSPCRKDEMAHVDHCGWIRNLEIIHLKSTLMVLQGGPHGVLNCSLTQLTSRVQKVLHL